MNVRLPTALVALGLAAGLRAAEPLPAETIVVEALPPAEPHWIVVNDTNFLGYMDSKVYLFDAESGTMLGMLSTGGYRNAVELAPDFSTIYSPETYYARGTRGARTDVVSFYDARTLESTGEVVIPPKRATGMPHRAYSGISDDGRFVFVANMTPATSVSVVDTRNRTFVEEVDTAGCALAYATGARGFASLCGDGTLLNVRLDDDGHVAARAKSAVFFDAQDDPVTEKAARLDDTWLFVSFAGWVHPVAFAGETATPREKWSLFQDADRVAEWKVGGLSFVAADQNTGELYVIVHQGGADTHKDPGQQIWVYDATSHARTRVIELVSPAATVTLSRDAATLLYTTSMDLPAVQVYDAATGEHLRTIEGPPFTPSFVQVPPRTKRGG